MGYLNVHLQKVIEKKAVSKTTIGRGDFIELFYNSETSSTNRYVLVVLNIWPRRGAIDKKLLHAIKINIIILKCLLYGLLRYHNYSFIY